jgi:long-chain acyl-CoA synthetase
MRSLTGQAVWEGYGISESASAISTGLMTSAARPGSVGRPLSGVQLRIVGDDGTDLYETPAEVDGVPAVAVTSDDPAADAGDGGEVGSIQIGGPTLFSGYWPDGTGGVDSGGWFTTGDLGYFDDAGELHLVDRAAETIRVAGFTVYPREVEDVLTGHPYVRDAAVIGAPGRAGEGVVAVLVAQRGTHPTPGDLDEYLAQRLPLFKRPQSYQLVDRLPRNEIGRIDRDAVRLLHRTARPLADDEPVLRTTVPADPPPDAADGADGADGTPVAPPPDVSPERAAALDELGRRLPGTGQRDRRSDEDTDDDLF